MTKQDLDKLCPECKQFYYAMNRDGVSCHDIWVQCNHYKAKEITEIDFAKCEKALEHGHSDRGWDQDDYYAIRELIEWAKKATFPFGPIPHWISVKDRLPDIGKHVLIADQGGEIKIGLITNHDIAPNGVLIVATSCGGSLCKYWMPLPPPPEGK